MYNDVELLMLLHCASTAALVVVAAAAAAAAPAAAAAAPAAAAAAVAHPLRLLQPLLLLQWYIYSNLWDARATRLSILKIITTGSI